MKNVRIQNIHENSRFPGVIYAELIDIKQPKGYQLLILATLSDIFQALKDPKREYNCINAFQDKFGNFCIKD